MIQDYLPEKMPGTDYERRMLSKVSAQADRLSLVLLSLVTALTIFIASLIYRYTTGHMLEDQFFAFFSYALVPLILGGFFWIATRSISEGISLMMDLEDSARSFLGFSKNQPSDRMR